MLLSIYIFAAVVGAILLAASILLGPGDDADADASADADTDVDADPGGDVDSLDAHVGGEGSLVSLAGSWRSTRFWSFFAAFFGATGAGLESLQLVASPTVTLVIATVVGLAVGQGAIVLFRAFARNDVGAVPSPADYVGHTARVLLGIDPTSAGKVRLQLQGRSVDLLAITSDEQQFAAGDEALIIAIDGTRAVVSRSTPTTHQEG
ncbi:MAG: hypothetical protein B7733_15925 [Myxococcales bacterium FL481]|nr:MAG: hypothetical protein B7733_15925 [Myxococcales bacterium FL481]